MPDFGDDRVMACTESDMQRWLRGFTGQDELAFANGQVSFVDNGISLTVTIDELPVRRLGLVKFRDSRIRFSYPPESADAAREWIRRFDHHTQRGGG